MYAAIRRFAATTCKAYVTVELTRESETCTRREAARRNKKGAVQEAGTLPTAPQPRQPKIVEFNVPNTYKYHCLADYPDYIELHGTTDNTTTQLSVLRFSTQGECEHIVVKIFYDRTNKIKPEKQIAAHQQRRGLLHGITEELERKDELERAKAADKDDEDMQPSMYARYVMGQSERHQVDLYNWLDANDGDPACEDFIPRLKNHLMARKLGMPDEEGVPEEYRDSLRIRNDVLWEHKTVQLCYTTYDMRRDQDTSNPRTHPDILLLTSQDDDDDFPFAYAHVVRIFHADVRYTGPGSTGKQWEHIEFLWVRWFSRDPTDTHSGFRHRRLPRITFNSDPPFGFVDPACVLRGAYMIPAWKYGITDQLLPANSVGRADGLDYNYEAYYTSFFVDRDMYMRFLGGGVGH
ncbi:hypothetical protein C8T65DRAFT_533253, partial [Cerioporus squamosus]